MDRSHALRRTEAIGRHWRAATALVLFFALSGAGFAAAADAPISANLAGLFIGDEKTVEGTVIAAERDGNVLHLRLGRAPKDLTISLVSGWLSHVPPDPEHYYLGKTVRVTGTVQGFRGVPEIVLHDANDIHLTGVERVVNTTAPDDSAPPPAPVAAAPDVSSGRTENEALRQRVQELEAQVRSLEERLRQVEHGSPGEVP